MEEEACFLHIRAGTYVSKSPESQVVVDSSESLLMKCGNYLGHIPKTADCSEYEAISVHFFPDTLKRVFESSLPKFLREKSDPQVSMTKFKADQIITRYFESVLFYFDNPDLVDEDILILKLKEIILLLARTSNVHKIQAILSNLFNPRSYNFRETIESHLYSSYSIPELATLCSMSPSTFKREFKLHYKDSPGQYFLRKKLEKSRDLLRASGESLSQVAFSCGFANLSHFSKAFKQQYQISPSQFRLSQLSNT